MCDPTTVAAGAALLAGGTYASNEARSDRREEMDEAAMEQYLLEQERQEDYDRERRETADQVFEQTAGRDVLEEQMAEAAEERLQRQRENERQITEDPERDYVSPAAGATTRNVQSRFEENREAADAELESQFGALAQLRSLGDSLQAFELFRRPLYGNVERVNAFARESGRVAPVEAEAAARGEADTKANQELIGQIAAGIGSAMIGSGAAGGGAAAGGSAAAGGGASTASSAAGSGASTAGGTAAGVFANPQIWYRNEPDYSGQYPNYYGTRRDPAQRTMY